MYYAFLHSAILSESRVSTVISRLYFFILIFTYRKKTKTTSLEELSKMHDIVFLFPKNRKKMKNCLAEDFHDSCRTRKENNAIVSKVTEANLVSFKMVFCWGNR